MKTRSNINNAASQSAPAGQQTVGGILFATLAVKICNFPAEVRCLTATDDINHRRAF